MLVPGPVPAELTASILMSISVPSVYPNTFMRLSTDVVQFKKKVLS